MAISEISKKYGPLIPGLPDEITEQCLLLLTFPELTVARSVSTAWNGAISSPSFVQARKNLKLSQPYIFCFSYQRPKTGIQWQAFDPRSRRWLLLPPMPCEMPVTAPAFACASIPLEGELYALGGKRSDTDAEFRRMVTYRTATNSWTVGPPMRHKRAHFAAASIDGKVFAAGGKGAVAGESLPSAECYDPERGRWGPVANLRRGLMRYDSAVMGRKLYVTEGWSWPFTFSPRGEVYDVDKDTWQEMSAGMKEGWTGTGAVVGDKLFVVPEHGDCRVKVYSPEDDRWRQVIGEGVPRQLLKPYVACGLEGCLYVMARGLDVGVGRLEMGPGGEWTVDWEIVAGPPGSVDYGPSNCQVLYA
ncbi:F-box protein AFR [Cinnamomum micranthum f. kanehirae]|uniref:F-box protein AFR n=1 Tax=Cinnamomum micranthum f. kanehirae TaxID=337451 RepID=A0A3S3NFV0_9MAGN|nr:F-box protein AFR [Cinnamomum micranthum f. kanehirae]